MDGSVLIAQHTASPKDHELKVLHGLKDVFILCTVPAASLEYKYQQSRKGTLCISQPPTPYQAVVKHFVVEVTVNFGEMQTAL